jgi:hypothetical protein
MEIINKPRSLSDSAIKPILEIKPINVYRSKSESTLRRPCFNGRITASLTVICNDIDGLDDLCGDYNSSDRSKLEKDNPYKICSLTFEQIRKFPEVKSNSLSHLITNEMEEIAYANSKNYKFGWDFVFKNSIKHNRFKGVSNRLGFLCEIVLPTDPSEYPNIDLTTITEKTENTDLDILHTAKRGAYEEIGIDLFGKAGRKIMHPCYQINFRKKYGNKIPYNFHVGSYGSATECFVLGVDIEDLIECQIIETRLNDEERHYRMIDRMIHRLLDD